MKKLIVANWKMNPASYKDALVLAKKTETIARRHKKIDVVMAPAFVHVGLLSRAGGHLSHASLGAQDLFWENPAGAYTGEISAAMLYDAGVRFVILGHSERRRVLHETDEEIKKKIKTAIAAKLRVILCVGEPLAVRRNGLRAAERYVIEQLRKNLHGVKNFRKRGVVAYEPAWAIGTGRSDNPKLSALMAGVIARRTGARVLYGGSVKAKNAAGFLKEKSIHGALVGGASLDAVEFGKIIEIASRL